MRSIERTLLAWLLGALTLGAVLVALVTYLVTLEEMNEVFDAELRNVAEAVATYHQASRDALDDTPQQVPVRTDVPKDVEIVTQTWSRRGVRIFSSDPRVKVPYIEQEGLSHPLVDGEHWIVYTSVRPGGVAQAAQRLTSRRQMAGESASQVLPPMLVLLLVVGGLLAFGLRRGLRPLDEAARDVAARSAGSLEPIATQDVPRELERLVASINGLLGRLGAALAAQRRFLADAAHALRTPVTALRLQAHLLRQSGDETARAEAVADLEAGIDRSQHLIEQLLQVARADPDGEAMRDDPVDLGELVRSVVGHFSALAEHRGIDLGAVGGTEVVVHGDAAQLTVLLNNLVENALRYTPRGGVVDVEAQWRDGRAMLRVADDGPGIAPAERERVFHRFHRGADAKLHARDAGGSGLGLAIARAIAERHGASITLHDRGQSPGLEARVLFGVPVKA